MSYLLFVFFKVFLVCFRIVKGKPPDILIVLNTQTTFIRLNCSLILLRLYPQSYREDSTKNVKLYLSAIFKIYSDC